LPLLPLKIVLSSVIAIIALVLVVSIIAFKIKMVRKAVRALR
jgi:hypothetical protein